jgi:acyl-CoA oxidase
MKFWIGAAANLANMTVCFAQLYSNGKHYGPHAFIVPIRNIKDHTLMPGVTIGDCGLKNGLNAIDNGFLVFKNVRIPLDNLLDRFSSISADGQYDLIYSKEMKKLTIFSKVQSGNPESG